MRKHYVAAFTRKDAEGREQSVCGQFIEPSGRLKPGERTDCWGCNLWFHEVEHPHTTPTERARVTDRDDHAPRRRLTRYERLEALADSGCDTWAEARGER
jgi:hypothetical protein